MKTKELEELQSLLSSPKNIIITTHKNPDGDAIGSSLGLYNFLLLKKHKVTVITPNGYPAFLDWMPGNNKILKFTEKAKKCKELINSSDIIFCLDFNTLNRIGELGDKIKSSGSFKVSIDHHPHPEDFADITMSDTNASSTCQLIFEFIALQGEKHLLNKSIANCLYTGIMTDTGSFRFRSTTSKTHQIIAALIEAGAENIKIHELIYDNNSEDKIRLLGYCLSEKLKVFDEFSTAIITLSKEELAKYNFREGDTEGIVNYALSIEGIRFAAFFSEKDDIIRISFRSKGKFSVNKFSRAHFTGGGHDNAAGGMSESSMDETISKFISLLPQYRKKLKG